MHSDSVLGNKPDGAEADPPQLPTLPMSATLSTEDALAEPQTDQDDQDEEGETEEEDASLARPREEEEDLTPEEGDVLEAGDYLVELEMQRTCPREILVEGLRRVGFSEVLLDQNPQETRRSRHHRFVGRLTRSVSVHQHPQTQWAYARRLKTDVLSELKLKFVDYPLTSGKIYETRFLSRMRSQPTRAMVEIDLREMGWEVLKLSALRRDMRIPGRTSASVTLWFAVLRWDGADSYVSDDDPFYFEEVL